MEGKHSTQRRKERKREKKKRKDETEKVAEAGSINSGRDALWDTRRGVSGGNDRLSYFPLITPISRFPN